MAENELAIPESGHLVPGEDPTEKIDAYQKVVQKMTALCKGPKFIANIQGKSYPCVTWWTTAGAALDLFAREANLKRLENKETGEVAYQCQVEVYHVPSGKLVARGTSMCSNKEKTWARRDEYAIMGMAQTRATSRAFKQNLSFLATLAGIEATPAEEMDFSNGRKEAQRYPTPPPEPVEKVMDKFKEDIHRQQGKDIEVDKGRAGPAYATYEPVGSEYGDENQVSDEEVRSRIIIMCDQMLKKWWPAIDGETLRQKREEKIEEYSSFKGDDGNMKSAPLHRLKGKWLRTTYGRIKEKWEDAGFGQLVNE